MKKDIRFSKLWLFGLITLICVFLFGPYIFGTSAFIVGWDMRTIYSSNFENLRTVLQSWLTTGARPYWTWYSFLGNDFYSSKLFYFNDFFEIPFALTTMRYDTAIMWMTYLKFLVAGFGFHAYAKYNQSTNRTALLGALMFTFSSYLLYVMTNPFFASFFVFLPYYFLSVDRYIKDKKFGFFIVMVFFMFTNNYYLFYSLSLFTILYFIWRWHKTYLSYKDMMKHALILIGYYMIGFLLSGIVVIPEVINILSNSRVGQRSSTLLYDSILPYVEYLTGIYTPVSTFIYRETPIAQLYTYVSANDSVMNAYLWCSSLLTLLFPQLFTKKNRDTNTIVSLGIISVVALVPILSSVMHGFSEPSFRWLASPMFFLLANILPFLDHPENINQTVLKYSILVFGILMILSTPCIAMLTGMSLQELGTDLYLPLLYLPTFLGIGYALYTKKENLLVVFLVIELSLASFMSYYGSPGLRTVTKDDYARWLRLMGAKNEYTNFTKQLDTNNEKQFYRNYIEPERIYWSVSTSFNLDFNIMGLLAYDSTYLPSMNDLIQLDPARVQHYLPWTFNIQNPDVMNLVSTKYAVVLEENEVPFTNYHYVRDYYVAKVYENDDYVNLGKTYTKVISYDAYTPSQSSVLNNTIIAHSEDLPSIQSALGNEVVACEEVYTSGNYLYASIHTNEPGFLVLSVPYDKGWYTTINKQPVETYPVSGGMTGIAIQQGLNEIEMTFSPRGIKLGAILSGIGVVLFVLLIGKDKIRKEKKL